MSSRVMTDATHGVGELTRCSKKANSLSLVRHHECGERLVVMCKRDGAQDQHFRNRF